MVTDIVLNLASDLKAEIVMVIGFLASLEFLKMFLKHQRKILKESAKTKDLNRHKAGRELFASTMSEREKAYVARLERRQALRAYARGR